MKDGKINYISTIEDSAAIYDNSEYKPNSGKIGNKVLSDKAIVFNLTADEVTAAKTESAADIKSDMVYCGYVADSRNGEWNVLVLTTVKAAEPSGDETAGSVMQIVTATKSVTYGDEDAFEITYIKEGTGETGTLIFVYDSGVNANLMYIEMNPGDIFIADADENNVVKDYTVLAQMTDFGVKVIPGAFEKAFGESFSGNNGLEYGVDYICGYISAISRKNTKQIVDITYGDGKVYTASLDNWTNMYSYTSGRHVKISAGDWYLDSVELPENEKCSPVFVKLYDGAVTDIYTLNTRVNISDVIMGSSERTQGGQTATVE